VQNSNLNTEDIYEKVKIFKSMNFFMNDGLYKGEIALNNYQREGHGVLYSNDGGIYIGNWHNNNILGYARKITPEGFLYEGYFKGNSLNGRGKFLSQELSYEGTFKKIIFLMDMVF